MSYYFETLSPERFQHFCQALIVESFPNAQCLPVGQPDGGRDAFLLEKPGAERIIFQVKFVRSPADFPDERKFIEEIVKLELPKVQRLIATGATAYYLLTNVPGTSHVDVGSIDKTDKLLSSTLTIPSYCWWRDDLARRLDNNSDVKWSYPEVIRAVDLLQFLLQEKSNADRTQNNAIRAYMAAQYKTDEDVRFKQIQLQNKLIDLFVDVPAAVYFDSRKYDDPSGRLIKIPGAKFTRHDEFTHLSVGEFCTASLSSIVCSHFQRIVLEGAPGQGKSTVTQFLCQVHRTRLLNYTTEIDRIPEKYKDSEIRIPFRVDLRDYANWIDKKHPYALNAEIPSDHNRSLERFLAFQVSFFSGGIEFSTADLIAFVLRSPILIVLDGFDEVADVKKRNVIVEETSLAAARLKTAAKSLQIIVTSRPAAVADLPGFSKTDWFHFELQSLTEAQIDQYSKNWMTARNLNQKEKLDFSRVIADKISLPHMRELARNPMQLAILLALIHTRGLSLPEKRTSLYDNYVELFFSRESEKSAIMREHRELLVEIHRYLAWVLHREAEETGSGGNISEDRLKHLLTDYLRGEGHPTSLVEDLFTGVTERVVALVSRVVGTFEFEVQPLREYFAARYLYETAPYSPPGAEKQGTKPDRFDALSKNLYWLNVTRFYCGCFSKGELGTLATSIEELVETREFRHLVYPRHLAMILLSDWVFSQQPTAIDRIVRFIAAGAGFRRILARMNPPFDQAPIVLPERCGRRELVIACKESLSEFEQTDTRVAALSIIRQHCSQQESLDYWISLRPSASNEMGKWLSDGSALAIYQNIPVDLASTLAVEIGESFIERLLDYSRYDVIEQDPRFFDKALDMILNGAGPFPYGHSEGDRLSKLAELVEALHPYLYMEALETNQLEISILMLRHHVYGRAARKVVRSKATNDLGKFLQKYHVLASLPVKEWQMSLKPWSQLIESSRDCWGETKALFPLAILAAASVKIATKAEVMSMFDQSIALCDRTSFAKKHAGLVKWWSTQAQLASTVGETRFFLLTLFSLANSSTIEKLSETAAALLDKLSPEDWADFANSIPYRRRGLQKRRHLRYALEKINRFATLSPRLLCTVAKISDSRSLLMILSNHLHRYRGKDPVVLEYCVDEVIGLALDRKLDWKLALATIRHAYRNDAGEMMTHFFSPHENMPNDVAATICENSEKYPLYLLNVADRSLSKSLGPRVEKVGIVADRDGWFSPENR